MSQLSRHRTIREDFKLPMDAASAEQLIAHAMRLQVEGRRREFDPDILRNNISLVARFLTTDSPKFGLMLMGLCGNGKTTLVKALQSILWQLDLRDDYGEKMHLSFYTAKALARMYAEEDQSRSAAVFRLPILAIDDLGNEPKQMMVYGNVVTPLTDILEIRYERRLFTIVTTNSTPEQIRADYGARIADRLNEMMEPEIFTNTSFR